MTTVYVTDNAECEACDDTSLDVEWCEYRQQCVCESCCDNCGRCYDYDFEPNCHSDADPGL